MFVWDASTGSTRRITDGDDDSINSAVSADGQHVVFWSWASNRVPDTDGAGLFLWDATSGKATRLTDGQGHSQLPSISGDGRTIAFSSEAFNLVPDDTNRAADIFVWNRTN